MTDLTPALQQDLISNARQVIVDETAAIQALLERIDDNFAEACQSILKCEGRVIVTGMGKSGHIGHKIAATLASTGTPAFFVHPSEALHGDLGMITAADVVIPISNSGTTVELVTLCSVVKNQGTQLIAMTGNPDSILAKLSHFHINISVEKEACPHDLAPTSSTTATLVMGDAIAITLLKARAFTPEDFARSHPAGRLGKRLSIMVQDLMHSGEEMPSVHPDETLEKAILVMTGKQLGATLVTDNNRQLISIFTDGDLRRAFEAGIDLRQSKLSDITVKGCFRIIPDALAMEALTMMQKHKITVLPVVDAQNQAVGVIHMHDLLKAGIV